MGNFRYPDFLATMYMFSFLVMTCIAFIMCALFSFILFFFFFHNIDTTTNVSTPGKIQRLIGILVSRNIAFHTPATGNLSAPHYHDSRMRTRTMSVK